MHAHPSVGWLCSNLSAPRPPTTTTTSTHLKTHPRKPEKTQRWGRRGGGDVEEWQRGREQGRGGVEVLCERGIRVRRLEVEDDIIW